MRLPTMRFTVKWLMGAVAMLAVTFGLVRLKAVREDYLRRANVHAQWATSYQQSEKTCREQADKSEQILARFVKGAQRPEDMEIWEFTEPFSTVPGIRLKQRLTAEAAWSLYRESAAKTRGRAEEFARYANYHVELKDRYRRAANRPWQTLADDPPPAEPAEQARYWTERGDHERAFGLFDRAFRHGSRSTALLNGFAWFLATCPDAKRRDGKRAVELATEACKGPSRADAYTIDTLAAAYAESGDFEQAAESEMRAIQALSASDPELKAMRDRLNLYKSRQPFRER
jgi:tetratricopeptide (TPR) repeat protein